MTAVPDNGSSRAGTTPEHSAVQIELLSPTPPGFTPEYDYILTLESACRESGLYKVAHMLIGWQHKFKNTWHLLRQSKTNPRACMVESSGSTDLFLDCTDFDDPVQCMHHEIKTLRERLADQQQGTVFALVVETVDFLAIQILGAAVDLDPQFLLRHLGADQEFEISDQDYECLKDKFYRCIDGWREHGPGRHGNAQMISRRRDGDVCIKGYDRDQVERPHRLDEDRSPWKRTASAISCSQMSTSGCKSYSS